MKRFALLLCLVPLLSVAVHAQSSLRYNYISKGITHISGDYELVDNGKGLPIAVRLENLQFPDGTDGYLVHMIFKGKNSIQIPSASAEARPSVSSRSVTMSRISATICRNRTMSSR